jgi:hypothetical protein
LLSLHFERCSMFTPNLELPRPDCALRGAGSAVPSALDRPLQVAFFRDAQARINDGCALTLRQMVEGVLVSHAATKAALPWMKLATFGDLRTAKGSLRHESNMLVIDGIEADYDDEKISIDSARAMLAAARLAAVVYTSPSHTPTKPRWRVLCPASTALPPESRAGLVGRLNGVLGGVLAGESFTASQGYYYGFVDGAEHHRAEAVEGRFIDLANDLDSGAIGRPVKAPKSGKPSALPRAIVAPAVRATYQGIDGGTRYGLAALAGECAAIRIAPNGSKHDTLNRAAFAIGTLAAGGQLESQGAFAALAAALDSIRAECRDFRAAQDTLKGAFEDGHRAPRAAPERHPQTAPAAIPARHGLAVYYPAPSEPRASALERQDAAITRTIKSGEARAVVLRDIARRQAEAAIPLGGWDTLPLAGQRELAHAARRDALDAAGLEALPAPARMLVTGAQGSGKTTAAAQAVATIRRHVGIDFLVPTLAKAEAVNHAVSIPVICIFG